MRFFTLKKEPAVGLCMSESCSGCYFFTLKKEGIIGLGLCMFESCSGCDFLCDFFTGKKI